MSQESRDKVRLDSWKEIAAYLNRDVRTVIRWERNGLPIHRVPGGKRQSVFAYPSEIDAWLKGGTPDNGPSNGFDPGLEQETPAQTAALPADPHIGAPRQPARTLRAPLLKRRGVMLACVGSVILIGLGAMFNRSISSAAVRPIAFRQLTDDNRYKTNLRTDGRELFFDEFEVNREILVSAPIAGGAVREIKTPFPNVELQDVLDDGDSILITSFIGTELDRPLWVISKQELNRPRRLGEVLCRVARWSPDHGLVACAHGTSISLLGSDGTSTQTLGPFQGVVVKLAWSPDGNQLRFVLQDLGTREFTAWEIALPRGSGPQPSANKLAWGQNCCADWAWTGDGKRFLYLKYETKPKLRMEGTSKASSAVESEIPLNIGYTAAVAGTKDPDHMYLLTQNSFQNEVLQFDSQSKVFQTAFPTLSATFLSFSRDGQWMSFTAPDNSLWRSRADGSDGIQLTKPPLEVELSSWSPDGTQIAFMGREPGRIWRIYLIGRDGGKPHEAAAGDDSQGAPTWSADGTKLAYGNVDCADTQTCWIRFLDLRSGKSEKLPDSHGARTARWSPDGKFIAALASEAHQLILFDVSKRKWTVVADQVTGDNVCWSHDSQFIYADSPRGEKPVIERFGVRDGRRSTVVSLKALEKIPGQMDFWFGLTPTDAPLLVHRFVSSEAYALEWTDR